jgi:hypothetical protein
MAGLVLADFAGGSCAAEKDAVQVLQQVPPRRSTQLADSFGMNVSLPREPRLPWNRHWWTRPFDSGVKWMRLGQYENSSERTSWDWVEQTPGHYEVTADLDEAIRSLSDNGVHVEIILQYSNPLYQGDQAHRPSRVVLPPPGIGEDDEPPNPIFIPPTTDEQINAFLGYVRFMVGRYKNTVKHWELWNEPDLGYWRPLTTSNEELMAKARTYGHLLCRVADTIHQIDPESRVMTGGVAELNLLFVQTALAECAGKLDVVAYHGSFSLSRMPEEAGRDAVLFREQILRTTPGINPHLDFWLNEWSGFQQYDDSRESVQARYLPRLCIYNHAQSVRTLMWTLVPATDGNEGDTYGILHGETFDPNAFQPRPAYHAFEVTAALFGQTSADRTGDARFVGLPAQYQGRLQSHAFRDRVSGKRIYAFWLAVAADPSDKFVPVESTLHVNDPLLRTPILIDVRTGAVERLNWLTPGTLRVPLKDSVMAVADASYLDWPELPEAPAELTVARAGTAAKLHWTTYGGIEAVEIERSVDFGTWHAVARSPARSREFTASLHAKGHITYRVRALGKHGASAWSNPAWLDVR